MGLLGPPDGFPRWHLRRLYEKALERTAKASVWDLVGLALLGLIAAAIRATNEYAAWLARN